MFVRNLGLTLDSDFKCKEQISALVQSSFYHWRLINRNKDYLPQDAAERVIHVFINSRPGCLNSRYCAIHQSLVCRLQLMQNSAY